ncbi:hypothetical protein [Actinoplanes solisilvae]|uniref:hypothetical protein n=1 Tax=Actinoplanes solisilvae TaxID=2486853 RepID=UPI00196AD259|nr:hypothetical protein [Actinoplanes solisilvae]
MTPYPMSAADQALSDLAAGRVNGAAVLRPSPTSYVGRRLEAIGEDHADPAV